MFSFGFIGGFNGLLESNRYTAMVRNWVGNTGGSNKVGTISRIQIEDTSGVTIKRVSSWFHYHLREAKFCQ